MATLQLEDSRNHLNQSFSTASDQEANGTCYKVVVLSCSSAVYCWCCSGGILLSSTLVPGLFFITHLFTCNTTRGIKYGVIALHMHSTSKTSSDDCYRPECSMAGMQFSFSSCFLLCIYHSFIMGKNQPRDEKLLASRGVHSFWLSVSSVAFEGETPTEGEECISDAVESNTQCIIPPQLPMLGSTVAMYGGNIHRRSMARI